MRIDVVSIFPDYFSPLELSLPGKARDGGLIDVAVHDLRGWTHDRHRTVDDTPYGGGAGMVMKPEPWGDALDEVMSDTATLVVPTPAGTRFDQRLAAELATREHLVFACGRYEGIDQRVLDHAGERWDVREVSLGDYVLNGGEVAALAIIEAVVRLLPGFMGNAESLVEESHADGLLEYPVYTKPPTWRGLDVPDVLRSGDHARIARWRAEQSLRRTVERRPDLLPATSTTTSVVVAPASAGDAGEILTLLLADGSADTAGNVSIGDVRARIAADLVLVARSGGRLVGFADVVTEGRRWLVDRLVAAPDLADGGPAGALLEHVVTLLPGDATGCDLLIDAGRTETIAAARTAGFRRRGANPDGRLRLTRRP